MSFFDDVVANVKVIATNVGQRASKIRDYSKLKYSEVGMKSEITKKKTKLGEYVYECSKTGDIDKIVMEQFVDEISELEENLQITQEMIAATKNKVTCEFCKAENEKDSVYCRKCGQKLNKVEETEEEVEETEETPEEKTCDGDCCSAKEVVEEVVEKAEAAVEKVVENVETVVEDIEKKVEDAVADMKKEETAPADETTNTAPETDENSDAE